MLAEKIARVTTPQEQSKHYFRDHSSKDLFESMLSFRSTVVGLGLARPNASAVRQLPRAAVLASNAETHSRRKSSLAFATGKRIYRKHRLPLACSLIGVCSRSAFGWIETVMGFRWAQLNPLMRCLGQSLLPRSRSERGCFFIVHVLNNILHAFLFSRRSDLCLFFSFTVCHKTCNYNNDLNLSTCSAPKQSRDCRSRVC